MPRPFAPANPTAAPSQQHVPAQVPVKGQDGSVVATGAIAMIQMAAGTGNAMFTGGGPGE